MPELSRFSLIHCLRYRPMSHPIHRVESFEKVAPWALRVHFSDGSEQTIDFRPVLSGELFEPLRDLEIFNHVELDSEAHTLVWPTGADFDPAALHDWPDHVKELTARARRWEIAAA